MSARALLALVVATTTVHAETDAARWFRDGNAAMDRDQPRVAATAYRTAWELEPRAKIALDLGVALAEVGDIAAAAEAFETYLADAAADPGKRTVIEQQLAAWRPQLGRIAVRVTPADAAIAIDGERPLRADGAVNVPALPGTHRIAIERPGYEHREVVVTVVARQTAESREQLAPIERHRGALWSAVGVAGLAAIVGTGASIVAASRWSDVHAHCPGNVCASPSDLALATSARRAGYVADTAFVVGGLALASAVVLWYLEPSHATLGVTSHGAVVGWSVAY